ncbi:putative 60s Acidic ribosomal protein [Trypanosoma vivax]|uniref:Putative 60S acidic ribosomal protein n=1 Tax=Trypanosoma vivax (strain Y486) TaxID=1055687 RepID=G0TVF3_TRYVY|nr:putative 60S acidic ribosomal protein [Trypanosoma vivax]KAH8617716.1 putative 60s Acidic ribosomal protein [Trypanosoma vivax]CCC47919.1 putative 60S acidic ribosomal protein [Trypanosoma vivax Y486]
MAQQLACTYAALILAGSGKNDAASLLQVTKAAGVDVSRGMAEAFASVLDQTNIEGILSNIAFGGGSPGAAAAASAPVAASGAAAAAPAAKAAKEEEEEDDDMGFGLFD